MELEHGSRLACADLLHLGQGGPSLMGSRCTDCGEVYFAGGNHCTRCCGTALVPCELGSRGRLWSWTVQGFLPKAPYNSGETETDFQPYGVGYVEMPSGIKVESRLTVADPALLSTGMEMVLTLVPYGISADRTPGSTAGGERLYTFAFRPAQAEEAERG